MTFSTSPPAAFSALMKRCSDVEPSCGGLPPLGGSDVGESHDSSNERVEPRGGSAATPGVVEPSSAKERADKTRSRPSGENDDANEGDIEGEPEAGSRSGTGGSPAWDAEAAFGGDGSGGDFTLGEPRRGERVGAASLA